MILTPKCNLGTADRVKSLTSVLAMKCMIPMLGLSLAVSLAWLGSSGCATRQGGSYQLVALSHKAILIPPGPVRHSDKPRPVTIRTAAGGVDCALRENGVSLEKRGKTLRVWIHRSTLPAGSPGWLARWADTLNDNGCLPRSQASLFARRVMESFPIEVSHTYSVAFGKSTTSRFIDFHPGQSLKAVRPVFRKGAETDQSAIASAGPPRANATGGLKIEARASPDLIGFEESWYAIQAMPDGLLHMTHDRTRFFQDGEATRVDVPDGSALDVVPASRYIRMVFLTRVASSHDHDVLFLVASTRRELEARYRAIQEDPNACIAPDNRGWCRVGPRELALNLYVMVTLNGVEMPVAPGTSMSQLLKGPMGGRVNETPQDLQVWRPYGNGLAKIEFDRSSPAVMSLPLLGGERISLPSIRQK